MNEQTRENISALMDGELPRQNLTGLIEDLSTDQDLQYLWNRYHIIGDAIRGESLDQERASIAEQVRLKLADEPVVLALLTPDLPQRLDNFEHHPPVLTLGDEINKHLLCRSAY